MAGWRVIHNKQRDDCIPLEDLVDHVEADNCFCRPSLTSTPTGKPLAIHHSVDGREYFEPDYTGELENQAVN